MHVVKRQGDNIGALALIVIDNPMCPGTGHRICNDCMKGCIYQKNRARQHTPDRDQRINRRVETAMGIRNLRAANALESTQH